MADLPKYELFAIRYATRPGRRAEHFIGGDPHDGPMSMDYFVWVARSARTTVVIDVGFNQSVATKRGRQLLRCPVESLGLLDVDPGQVSDVILTHLHYDHAGNLTRFPTATLHVQDREVHFATGRFMRFPGLSQTFEVEDICNVVRLNFASRVAFHDGNVELLPGLELIAVGGHTAGLQFVRVHTRRGWVALASDVTHFYENIATRRPFTVAFNLGDMHSGFEKVLAAADSTAHVVPGHDPLVMDIYPPPRAELAGIVARLDVAPSRDCIAELAR
jgi:glyoxylase-like metal-dependent hydrolase (beta-lactamase superfamily II)